MMAWTLHTAESRDVLVYAKNWKFMIMILCEWRVTGELSMMFYFCRMKKRKVIEKFIAWFLDH
jgi:hypothetical protein